MIKFKNTYRIPSSRLKGWDYGSSGIYFVTICTKDRQHYFGEIVVETDDYPSLHNGEMHNRASLRGTEIGMMAQKYWNEIPIHFPFVALDEFVIMPNHVHGILLIDKQESETWTPNVFGKQSRNLASIIRAYKASVKRFSNSNEIPFAWQVRYFDRIIRNEHELQNIRQYILNNPVKWSEDMNNPENLMM